MFTPTLIKQNWSFMLIFCRQQDSNSNFPVSDTYLINCVCIVRSEIQQGTGASFKFCFCFVLLYSKSLKAGVNMNKSEI